MVVRSVPLETADDARAATVRVGDQFYLIPYEDANAMQAHLSGQVCEQELARGHAYTEKRVREHFLDSASRCVLFAFLHA